MELVPPVSREDSFEQAREAIEGACAKRAKKAGKKRRSSGKALRPLRVAVELPIASGAASVTRAMVEGAAPAASSARPSTATPRPPLCPQKARRRRWSTSRSRRR